MSGMIFKCPECGEQFPISEEESEWAKPCPKCGVSVLPPTAVEPTPTAPVKSAPLKIRTFDLRQQHPVAAAPPPPSPAPTSAAPALKAKRAVWEPLAWLALILVGGGVLVWWLFREPKPPATQTAAATPATTEPAPANAAGTKPEQLPTPPPAQTNTAGTKPEPAPVPAQAGTPIEVMNPGFESGFSGWRVVPGAGSIRLMSEAAHTGKRGARMTDESAEKGDDLMCQRFKAEPGARYEARCWMRYVSGDGAGLYLRFFNAKNKGLNLQTLNNEIKQVLPKEATAWTELSVNGTAPEGAATGEIWVHTMSAAIVTVDVDDFSLRKLE